MRNQFIVGVGVVAVLSLCLGAPAKAETKIDGVAGGMSVVTPMGDNYQSFSQPTGFRFETWAENESLLGSVFLLHGSIAQHNFEVRGLSNTIDAKLNQWAFLVGVETGRHSNPNWIRPFISADIGGAYSSVKHPAGGSTKNAAFHLAGELRSGVEVPVWGKLSAQIASPLMVVFSSNKFVTVGGEFSLRWAL